MMDDYETYSENLETPSVFGNSYGWQRVFWEDPLGIRVVWQRVRSWWDYNYTCVLNVAGIADAAWWGTTGWRKGTFDGEGHVGSDCSTHEHIAYGTYHNYDWCYPWSVSLEIYTRNTPDALGGLSYNHWEIKEATSFLCNTLWAYWESS